MRLSVFDINDGLLGQTVDPSIRIVTVEWPGVHINAQFPSIALQKFKDAWAIMFPRRAFQESYVHFTPQSWVAGGQLFAMCETSYSDVQVRAAVQSLARDCGFVGSSAALKVKGQSIGEIEGGAALPVPASTVTPALTTDGYAGAKRSFLRGVADGLGVSLPTAAIAVLVGSVLLLRR